jgi:hypothetical protein
MLDAPGQHGEGVVGHTPSDPNLPTAPEQRGPMGSHANWIPGHHTFEPYTIDLSLVVKLAIALVVAAVGTIIVCVWVFNGLTHLNRSEDTTPVSPLAELAPTRPEGPILQASPAMDMKQMLHDQNTWLSQTHYDAQTRTWQIPIDSALQYVLQHGLPRPAATKPATAPAMAPASGATPRSGRQPAKSPAAPAH